MPNLALDRVVTDRPILTLLYIYATFKVINRYDIELNILDSETERESGTLNVLVMYYDTCFV